MILGFLGCTRVCAQTDTARWEPAAPAHYGFVKYDQNTISRQVKLDPFLEKLQALKHTHKGKVTIVHIGDSHLQADGITSVLRNGFQNFFGDAGRGLLFPYQAAGTNGPHDLASAGAHWHSVKVTTPSLVNPVGVSGYVLYNESREAELRMKLLPVDDKQEYFDQVTFFVSADSDIKYEMTDSALSQPMKFNVHEGVATMRTPAMMTGFSLSAMNKSPHGDHSFYGAVLEKADNAGVLYHTIGVNGARMDQYLGSDLFLQQLKELHADLVIVSLGTNEAQNPGVAESALAAICDSFLARLHKACPGAVVMFTTPAGSYYRKKKPNAALETVARAYSNISADRGLPDWDLFKICGGKAGIPAWKKYGLLGNDLVHYTTEGYQLQGQLLLDAFAHAYNGYIKTHRYAPKPPVKPKAKPAPVAHKPANKQPPPAVPQKPAGDSMHHTLPEVRPHKSNIKVQYDE